LTMSFPLYLNGILSLFHCLLAMKLIELHTQQIKCVWYVGWVSAHLQATAHISLKCPKLYFFMFTEKNKTNEIQKQTQALRNETTHANLWSLIKQTFFAINILDSRLVGYKFKGLPTPILLKVTYHRQRISPGHSNCDGNWDNV